MIREMNDNNNEEQKRVIPKEENVRKERGPQEVHPLPPSRQPYAVCPTLSGRVPQLPPKIVGFVNYASEINKTSITFEIAQR